MYSNEIQSYLEGKNYHVTIDEIYDDVINTSHQIVLVKFGEVRDEF